MSIKSCAAICGLLAVSVSLSFRLPDGGRTLPSVEVKALNGKTVNLSTISNDGKPMILIAWEVTCQPCIVEFNAIAKKYKAWQAETGVRIVAVSVDDNRSSSRVAPLVRSRGWEYDVYLDPSQAFKRAMNVPACPQTWLLDGKGQVVWQKTGYALGDEDLLYDLVKKIAAGQPVE